MAATATAMVAMPSASARGLLGLCSGIFKKTTAAITARTPRGRLNQNTQRQPTVSVNHPPSRGATTEEKGFDPHLTAGGQLSLLTHAWRVLPGIEELPILEQWVGFRPGSRDDAPILGAGPEVEGLFYATGHHRNGILLLPATVTALAGLILEGRMEADLAAAVAPFGAGRFAAAKAAE